jgi:cell division protein FtsN
VSYQRRLRVRSRTIAALPRIPGYVVGSWRITVRLSAGCAGLALLSACATSNSANLASETPSTGYYVSHAAGDYRPPGPASDPWGPYVNLAANRFDVPDAWIRQVMRAESGGHEYMNGQLTVSSAGAMGLMQLEPATYQEMASRYGLGSDPFNPYDNIMAGAAYIHEMYAVYGSPGFLAAYNAGPGRLNSFMNYNKPLPYATTNYVAEIAPQIQGYYPTHRSEADQLALNTEPAGVSTGILPVGFTPNAPAPFAPDHQDAPVQVAMLTPTATAPEQDSSIYSGNTAPTPPTPPPTYQQPAYAAPAYAAPVQASYIAPPPAPAPKPVFSLIPAAMADTPPPQQQMQQVTPGHTGWAIQLGSYHTRGNANAAVGLAELSAVQMLMHGQPVIVSSHYNGVTKYRARVVGLPHDDAINACQRLANSPTGCVVLSPEAQG